jgi:Domain of unknown function DUF29
MSASRLYDEDFYAWANEQAALLRAGRLAEADIAHIAEEQRDRLIDHMADNPSLTSSLGDAIASAYRLAILGAARETGLDRRSFPADCPWSYAEITDGAFWPDGE